MAAPTFYIETSNHILFHKFAKEKQHNMQYLTVLIVAALVFGVCFLFDKGFEKLFRNQAQHFSGLSVRLNKRYAAFGAVLIALGVAAFFTGLTSGALMLVCGILIVLMGAALVVYYATFGKRSGTYRYRDIKGQRLYVIQGGSVVVELHMMDGRSVNLQSTMVGTYDFLDHAFTQWCRQTGKNPEDCDFHDTENHLWFPTLED